MDELRTVSETAARLGISARRVHAMLAAGLLSGEKRSGVWFITLGSIETLETNRRQAGRPKGGGNA